MPLALSEDSIFVHLNVPKLIFMLPICELTGFSHCLPGSLVLAADFENHVIGL